MKEDDRALGKNRREGWETMKTMTGSGKGAEIGWAGDQEEHKSELLGQRGWEMMMVTGARRMYEKIYKGKQMEMIWWEIEVQSWAWLAEESVGQGRVRKRRGIQARQRVKEESALRARALWIDWYSLELIWETEKAKMSGKNENTESEFSYTWRKQLFRVLLVFFLPPFVPFYIELFWEMGISISM